MQFIIEGIGVWKQKLECYVCSNTNKELNECEKCNGLYCEKCSSVFDQFSQIDYNCCENCAKRNYNDD